MRAQDRRPSKYDDDRPAPKHDSDRPLASEIGVDLHAVPVRPESASTTRIPRALRTELEQESGVDLSDVRVHRDSPEPARLGAVAFARGAEIHLEPGQEGALPHEAWHIVQQRQGRVAPTGTVEGEPVNDDPGFEAEADHVGEAAARRAHTRQEEESAD